MRNRTPIWTTAARADLFEDYDYISIDNPAAADRFVLDFDDKVRSFSELGLTGVSRRKFGTGIRSFAYRKRIVFFRLKDNRLIVLRVLHGHQHVSPDDFTNSEI